MDGAWSDLAAEDASLYDITASESWAFVELCTQLTHLSGSADQRAAFDYLASSLAAWRSEHALPEPDLFISWPTSAWVALTPLEAGNDTLRP